MLDTFKKNVKFSFVKIKKDMDKLVSKVKTVSVDFNNLKNVFSQLEHKFDLLEKNLKNQNTDNFQKELAKIKSLETKINKMSLNLVKSDDFFKIVEAFEKSLAKHTKDIDALRMSSSISIASDVSKLKKEFSLVKRSVSLMKKNSSDVDDKVDQKLDSYSTKKDIDFKINSVKKEIQKDVKDLQKSFSLQMKQKINDVNYSEEVEEVYKKSKVFEDKIESLQKENRSLKDLIKDLRKDIKDLQKNNDSSLIFNRLEKLENSIMNSKEKIILDVKSIDVKKELLVDSQGIVIKKAKKKVGAKKQSDQGDKLSFVTEVESDVSDKKDIPFSYNDETSAKVNYMPEPWSKVTGYKRIKKDKNF